MFIFYTIMIMNCNNIVNKHKFNPPRITWHKEDPVLFKEFPAKLKNFGECRLSIESADDAPYNYILSVQDLYGDELGYEKIIFNFPNKYIFGLDMQVEEPFRQKYGVGELLRLGSIMEMFKNNLEKIKLFAESSAVMFHSRYDFKPNITKMDERKKVICALLKANEPGTKRLQKQGNDVLQQLRTVDEYNLQDTQNIELYRRTNNITENFIQILFKNKKNVMPDKQPFNHGMDMVLTKEDIINNRDYYNHLFEKHNIDFEI